MSEERKQQELSGAELDSVSGGADARKSRPKWLFNVKTDEVIVRDQYRTMEYRIPLEKKSLLGLPLNADSNTLWLKVKEYLETHTLEELQELLG